MNLYRIFTICLAPILLFGYSKGSNTPGPKSKPNIILIITDDQGYGDLSCYPHLINVDTPNIDKLAESGVRFTNGYVTHHGCAPSRAAIFSGRYQQRLGFYDIWEVQKGMPENEKLLSEYLHDVGYKTGLIGKWHLGEESYNHPLHKGYDNFFGFIGGMHDYFDPFTGDTWLGGANGLAYIYDQKDTIDNIKYLTEEFTDRAIDFIRNAGQDPFFLHLAYNAPHGPFQAPNEYIEQYSEEDGKYRIIRAMNKSLDDNIGRLKDYLDTNHISDNTIIIYINDNGGTRAHHNWILRGFKGMLSEGGIRVPFIISYPPVIPKGKVYNEPVISLDIFPTILSMTGIPLPNDKTLDGINLEPFLTEKVDYAPHGKLFWSWDPYFNQWAVREGQWKALREVVNGELVVGLFNLNEDVSEMNNLIETYPEKFKKLESDYQRWISRMPPSLVGEDEWTPNGNGWKYKYEH